MVSSLVVSLDRGSSLVVSVSLDSESSVLLTSRSESSHFSVLLRDDPVDSWVVSDGSVGWVDHDDLEELEGGVLSNPVRVEDSQSGELSSDSLLGNGLVVLLALESGDTDGLELSADDSLWSGSLSVTSSDLDSVDDVALLGLVPDSSGLLDSGRSGDSVDGGELSVLPGSHSLDELHDSGLFLLPKLLKILVSSHL